MRIHRVFPQALRRCLWAALGMAIAGPAAADVELCNETKALRYQVVLGYYDPAPKSWVSQGWFVLAPGKCTTVHTGPIAQGAIYLYADYFIPTRETGNLWTDIAMAAVVADSAGSISGEFGLCSLKQAFEILGDTKCRNRGFDHVGAVEIKTGDATSISVELFDRGQRRVSRAK